MKILRNVAITTMLVLAVLVVRAEAHVQSCPSAADACIAQPDTNMIFPYDPDYYCSHNNKHWWYQCINVVTEQVLWQGWCEMDTPSPEWWCD